MGCWLLSVQPILRGSAHALPQDEGGGSRKAPDGRPVEGSQLEHRAISLHHLMLESSPFGKACRAARCGVSGKRRNAADGLLSITQRAGLPCPLTSLDRTCGGKHHGAQSALSADKGDPVKWCRLIARCSRGQRPIHLARLYDFQRFQTRQSSKLFVSVQCLKAVDIG